MQMNPEDQAQYIQSLIQGKVKPKTELEAVTLGQLRGVSNDVAQKKLKHDALADEVTRLKNEVMKLNGQREAYVSILLAAEVQRKIPKPDKVGSGQPPISLEELRQRAGATKVEAVDKSGNVLAATEEKGQVEKSDEFHPSELDNPFDKEPPDQKDESLDTQERK